MPQIDIQPDEQIFKIGRNQTVLHASLYAGIPHTHVCGGQARCSTCRILIIAGVEHCDRRTIPELLLAQKLGFTSDIRLACQTKVRADIKIKRLVLDIEDEKLARDQLKFGKIGEERQLAVLFSDIRGFTKLSEAMLPYDVIYILNRYFQAMGEVIDRYDGTINNYMGDGFMVLFGMNHPDRPNENTAKKTAENAVRAALKMIEALENLNSRIELLFEHPLKVGIGIHYGTVVLGAVGTRHQKNITAIGDAVNFASRIESANKEFGTTILISSDIYKLVSSQVTVGSVREVDIRGKSGTHNLYEVIGIMGGDISIAAKIFSARAPSINKINNYLEKLWQLLQTKIF